ncbi:DUF3883 domain-containing protein [Streptosporangium sp. NPDC051022]|uniref:protein NO VEIN domain-containing protein n=1 Tax=Streptosporangium sp. NPDC051022 TaxID=3155752 RepID=UPI0034198594
MTQYGAALDWLRHTGMVTSEGRLSTVSNKMELALLKTAVAQADPLWLRDADQLITTSDDLPEDVVMAGEVLGLDPRETLAAVRAAWGKVDTTSRQEIGSAGEQALVRLLQDLGCLAVSYVAEYADGLGYDVAVDDEGFRLNLEVKSTTRRGRLTLYLSRNEFEVMLTDPQWRLVIVLVGTGKEADAIGTLDGRWITHHVPADTSSLGRWESVRFDVPADVVQNGIPDLIGWVPEEDHLLRSGAGKTRPSWLKP